MSSKSSSFRGRWRLVVAAVTSLVALSLTGEASPNQEGTKPNILFILVDNLGCGELGVYGGGILRGAPTPRIDKLASEGTRLLNFNVEAQCTPSRSALMTGRFSIRSGTYAVPMGGEADGLTLWEVTIALQKFGPRGVLHCWATTTDDTTVDPAYGKVGMQQIENTGSLTIKRMQTIDDEFADAAVAWMDKQAKAGKPFFCYYNTTRMHIFTRLKPESEGKTGYDIEADGMVEHDGHVGQLLEKLDDLGIADKTIVVYTSDNGAEMMTWPDGGSTPYRGEKATNGEGGCRVPTLIRWPGVIKPGTVYNHFFAHEDLLPTFAAAAGNAEIVAQCLTTCQLGNNSYHVHLDGYNLMPFFKGEGKDSPRQEFLYWSDGGDLFAIRVRDWKISFIEQYHEGLDIWTKDYTRLRGPGGYNLRSDPFERGPNSCMYDDWWAHRAFLIVPAQAIVAQWIQSFKEFPIRQRPASFNLDEVMNKLAPKD